MILEGRISSLKYGKITLDADLESIQKINNVFKNYGEGKRPYSSQYIYVHPGKYIKFLDVGLRIVMRVTIKSYDEGWTLKISEVIDQY